MPRPWLGSRPPAPPVARAARNYCLAPSPRPDLITRPHFNAAHLLKRAVASIVASSASRVHVRSATGRQRIIFALYSPTVEEVVLGGGRLRSRRTWPGWPRAAGVERGQRLMMECDDASGWAASPEPAVASRRRHSSSGRQQRLPSRSHFNSQCGESLIELKL